MGVKLRIRVLEPKKMGVITYVHPYHTYTTPFLANKGVKTFTVQRAHKQALEIPMCVSNEKFEPLGVHNTLEEVIEAHCIAHLERLTKTPTGRKILNRLRIPYRSTCGEKQSVPTELRKGINIPPLPKNMHLIYNEKRRGMPALLLMKQLRGEPPVVYTDTASYKQGKAMVSVVTDKAGKVLTACSIRTQHPEEGEELAIALALGTTHEMKIVSDSQPAIRNFTRGRISSTALRVLAIENKNRDSRTTLIWTPAHSALEDNERANEANVSRYFFSSRTAPSLPGMISS